VTTVLASHGLSDREESTFRAFHGLPDLLEPVLWAPMQFGSAAGPLLVALGAWIAWRQWRPAVGALVVGFVGRLSAQEVKDAVGRGRPHELLDDLARRAGAPTDDLGFLSSHVTVAFALAAVLSPYLSRSGRVAAYGIACIVAVARMHVGAHFPLDVVGGAAFGYGLGWLWNTAVGHPGDRPRTNPLALWSPPYAITDDDTSRGKSP
jgi:membrane-associated phospholipid phosphatase